MKKRKAHLLILIMTILLCTTGCSSTIPELTEEQGEQIAQYSVGLLLKYDKNHISRLVDLEEIEEEEDNSAKSEKPETNVDEENTGMPPLDDTPVIPLDEEQEGETEQQPQETIQQFFGLPEGVSVRYQEVLTAEVYPQTQGAVTAESGNKLLVLKFQMKNESQATQYVDIFSKFPDFKIKINGGGTKNVLYTMLPDDLSVYMGDIAAGETVDLVLLVEVESSLTENIEKIELTAITADKTSNLFLE